MTLPVSVYLIEHPKGLVLIDTGWHSKYVRERPHRFFGLLDGISTPVIQEGESIDHRLAALGLKDTDLDYLFFSHLDFDHTSGAELVSGAKKIMASEEEIADADKLFFRYVKENWKMIDLQPFSFSHTGIGPVGKSYDVFGDGSFLLVNTPGHSHGHCSAKITGEGGRYVVLGGDAAYMPESFSQRIIPGFTVSNALAKKSLEWLIECRADPLCMGVYVNHDPTVEEQILEV